MRISDWSSDVCSSDLARHRCRGAAGKIWLPAGGAVIWRASARRSRAWPRSSGDADGRRPVDTRSHRIPEDADGTRPADLRTERGRLAPAAGNPRPFDGPAQGSVTTFKSRRSGGRMHEIPETIVAVVWCCHGGLPGGDKEQKR